jgi:hypothetical protein
MNKESGAALGTSLTTLVAILYGHKHNKGLSYWIFAIFILAPLGGTIGAALGKEDKEAKALQAQALSHAIEQDAIEACRKRECKDNAGVYFDGQCHHDGGVLNLSC